MNAEPNESPTAGTDVLNELLRSELSAVETYTHAIGLIEDPTAIAELQRIRDDHRRAERELRECVVERNGVPAGASGVWPAFAATAAAGAKAIGCASLLAPLRQCEEYAIVAFEGALNHEDLHPACHRLIGSDLLPAARRHVDELNRLLGGTC